LAENLYMKPNLPTKGDTVGDLMKKENTAFQYEYMAESDDDLEYPPAPSPSQTYGSLQTYINEIKRYRLLTREEEKELGILVREKNDQRAAQALITSNLRLVVKIAMDFNTYWTKNLLDLIQEGNVGLLHAVKKFDPYRGIKFSYYASFWIKAYVLKFIMDNWKLVRIGTTQGQRKLFFNLGKERDKLLAQGFRPDPKLLAKRMNVEEREVIEMTQRMRARDISLDTPINDDLEAYGSFLPDPRKPVDEQISEVQTRQLLAEKLHEFRTNLSGKEADIFDNRIMAEKGLTLQELGDKYHISRERVRQIQEKMVDNIKRWLEKCIPRFNELYLDFVN
jgi:RNA polymerase sigma-32 factor